MTETTVVLILVIVTALGFDFTNGFHDTANAMATSIIGTVAGYLCFAVVLFGVALGITFIVASGFGKAISFEHVYPTIVDK
ncbi:hypothetical protein [Dactylosporangium sp. NBC_01737]|uniref:hypothetical protein n=1 Tax=Dactylosporangium sp. NBC_01737 TaxID=2975959 RepID=UPI002E165976